MCAEGSARVGHGRGAFVHEIPIVKRTTDHTRGGQAGNSFAEGMRKAGLDPRTELADLATVPVPADVTGHLEMSAG
jgi:GntR family transcriptional regulator